jgi:hypothetical protein
MASTRLESLMYRLLLPLSLFALGCTEYNLATEKTGPTGAEDEETPGDDEGETTGDWEGKVGDIKGRICDLSGNGYVVGALVYVEVDTDGDGEVDVRVESVTDADGYFLLEDVPLGEHVIHVEKGSFTALIDVTLDTEDVMELAEEECLSAEELHVAVITGSYDRIQSYLDDMGVDYDTYAGATGTKYIDLLTDLDKMKEYDIIFLNCGISDGWITSHKGDIGSNIREYVEGGGSIYASDWAHFFFEVAFPDAVDFYGSDTDINAARYGAATEINARVLDENMKAILGSSTARLSYDLDAWVIPERVKDGVIVLAEGDAPTYWFSTVNDAPLAVKLEKAGNAIYTTFHNESQATVDMELLLEEIILSL